MAGKTKFVGSHGPRRVARLPSLRGMAAIAMASSLMCTSISAAQVTQLTVTATPAQAQIAHPATSTTVSINETDSSDLILTWTIGTNPTHGSVAFQASGCPGASIGTVQSCVVTYTPTANYVGSDTFGITVSDSSQASQTVTVTATTYPSPPIASNFTVQTSGSTPAAVDLVKSGHVTYDPAVPISGVTITIAAPPAHGSATVSGTTITYTPNSAFAGNDTIAYQVSDGALTDASANMTVAVAQTTVSIPADIVGQPQAAGSAELTAAGFVVTIAQQVSATVAPGRVITTQPSPGTAAASGSTVKLIVSQGPGSVAGGPISSVPGLTAQQVAAARGVEKTCSALAGASTTGTTLTSSQQDLLDKCAAIIADYSGGTNVPGLQQTLNSISGRQATATARIPMQFAAGQIANVGARLDALRAGEHGLSLSGLDFGMPGPMQLAFKPLLELARGALGGGAGDDPPNSLLGDRLGLFLSGTLRRGSEATTDAEEGFDFKYSGLTLGADYRLGDSYVLGVAAGYGKSRSIFDDSAGRLDARHWSESVYGSFSKDRFHIDLLAGFGHVSYDLFRNIQYGSSSSSVGCGNGVCSTDTTGNTGAREYSLVASSGMDFHRDAFAFGPTLELDYKQVGINGFTEAGPSGLDLNFGGMSSSSLLAKLGGYGSYAYKTVLGVIVPQVRLRYVHEFLNDPRTQTVEFAADTLPGAADRAFQVYTAAINRNYLDWRASVLWQFPHGIAAFAEYGGLSGLQNIRLHELNLGVRIETGLR
jgi:uncharacterized protein YhjY with autotransporter beta-barrel domain